MCSYIHLKLQSGTIDFPGYWRLNRTKYIDGCSRSIHYGLMYKALYTRSKLSHFTETERWCKLCSVGGEEKHEDVYHVFIECRRVKDFWIRIEQVLREVDPTLVLNNENKIFGIIGSRRNGTFMLMNMIIHVAQRVIWFARKDYEDRNVSVDLWSSLKQRLYILVSRAQYILPPHRFTEVFGRSFILGYVNEKWFIKI
jgi:hypothetical protein